MHELSDQGLQPFWAKFEWFGELSEVEIRCTHMVRIQAMNMATRSVGLSIMIIGILDMTQGYYNMLMGSLFRRGHFKHPYSSGYGTNGAGAEGSESNTTLPFVNAQ